MNFRKKIFIFFPYLIIHFIPFNSIWAQDVDKPYELKDLLTINKSKDIPPSYFTESKKLNTSIKKIGKKQFSKNTMLKEGEVLWERLILYNDKKINRQISIQFTEAKKLSNGYQCSNGNCKIIKHSNKTEKARIKKFDITVRPGHDTLYFKFAENIKGIPQIIYPPSPFEKYKDLQSFTNFLPYATLLLVVFSIMLYIRSFDNIYLFYWIFLILVFSIFCFLKESYLEWSRWHISVISIIGIIAIGLLQTKIFKKRKELSLFRKSSTLFLTAGIGTYLFFQLIINRYLFWTSFSEDIFNSIYNIPPLYLQIGAIFSILCTSLGIESYRNLQIQDKEKVITSTRLDQHFVKNVITAIISLIRKKTKIKEATKSLTELSKWISEVFYQINLDDKSTTYLYDNNWNTLNKEIELCELYISLSQLRFDNIKYHKNIDPSVDLDYAKIPRFTLQPLIENACEHARPSDRALNISLKIEIFKGFIKCIVDDDGIGRKIAKEKVKTDPYRIGKKSFGTQLIKKNLKDYGIKWNELDKPDTGFQFEILIPYS